MSKHMHFPRAPRPLFHLLLCVPALSALPAAVHAQKVLCQDHIDVASPVLSNGFGLNARNTRMQASAIRSDNVQQLKLHHVHVAEGEKEKRGAPAITAQTIFFAEGMAIVAANRASGCEYWRYEGARANRRWMAPNNIRSAAILLVPAAPPHPALVIAGDFRGHVYAVDARTGKEVWQRFMGTDPARHMVTGGLQVHQDTLFVPVATNEVVSTIADVFSDCCESHGLLQAVDVHSGRIKWTYHTAPPPRFDPMTRSLGPSGMSIWGTPMIDEAHHAVVVGTGQNLSLPTTTNSDAIISLDVASGRVRWVFQAVQGDAWNAACQAPSWLNGHCPSRPGGDFDFGAPPLLATLPDGAQAILAGSKNGTVYSLDPADGKLNWSRKLGVGGSLGGIHWGMAADAQQVYAAVTDVWVNKVQRLSFGRLLTHGVFGDMAPVPGARPGIYALDLRSGQVRWHRQLQHLHAGQRYNSLFSAALSVTNDVLLAGSLDGSVYALRSRDGRTLWSYNTVREVSDVHGVQGHGGTIDSVGPVPAGGDLMINAGYSTFGGANAWQGGPGNALFVFRLP
ncbi:MAG: PQQ-binding-like beta-propeller repeat protein [Aquabacterium sp.]